MKLRLVIAAALAGSLLASCDSKPAPPPAPVAATPIAAPAPAPEPIATQAPQPRKRVDEAPETAMALATYHPVACRIGAADWSFGTCHDDVNGYGNSLACVRKALAAAKAELPKTPSADDATGCAGSIRKGIRESGDVTARFLADFVAWMEANRGALQTAMARKPLSEACDDLEDVCSLKPSQYDPKYDGYGYAHVQKHAQCTKSVFVCGTDDNVCWLPKVASRLGVACDPNENTTGPLLSRATRQRILIQGR